MEDADRLNAQSATTYAAVYWLGLIVAASAAAASALLLIGYLG